MKSSKKFSFNAEQTGLINSSFNEFTNDAIKEIAADSTVGGKDKVGYLRIIYRKVIYGRIVIAN